MEKIIIGNLKMNLNEKDVEKYVIKINNELYNNVDLYIAPSSIYLEQFKSDKYHLTAQDVSEFSKDSYTGEISATQLKSIGVDSVIIGHNERRKFFSEDSNVINNKIRNALENDLKVILCIGTNNTLKELELDLKDIINLKDIIIAYEPEYAIGRGKCADISEIKDMICKIKEKYNTKVVYGGSVNLNNIREIVKVSDGVIVGKMSLNVEDFKKMIKLI